MQPEKKQGNPPVELVAPALPVAEKGVHAVNGEPAEAEEGDTTGATTRTPEGAVIALVRGGLASR